LDGIEMQYFVDYLMIKKINKILLMNFYFKYLVNVKVYFVVHFHYVVKDQQVKNLLH
jgi:hypothetical protein